MSLIFPDTPLKYVDFFKELAKAHKKIQHDKDPNHQHFSIVAVGTSISSFSQDDITEYLNKRRSSKRNNITETYEFVDMCLIQMDYEQSEAMIKANKKIFNGGFFIAAKPLTDKPEDRDYAMDLCYTVGEDILSAMRKFFLTNDNYLMGKLLEVNSDAFKHAQDVGWKWFFSYSVDKTSCYNPDNFNDLQL